MTKFNEEASKTFYYDEKPSLQIKGDYIYAFNELGTRALSIAEIEAHILHSGDIIED
jgi:hypothetical protein